MATDTRATTSLEYAVLAAVIAVGFVAVFQGLAPHLAGLFHLPVRAA